MPTVPGEGYGAPQVAQEVMPSVRVDAPATAEAFGGGPSAEKAFGAAEFVASQGRELYMQEKQHADNVATQDAFTKAVNLRNQLMYSTDTENPGAFTKKGKDAFGVNDEYMPKMRDGLDKIQQGLGNDQQRYLFQRMRDRETRSFGTSISQHVFSETQKYDDETTKAGVETQMQDAVLNYQTPGAVDGALKIQGALLQSKAERAGWSPEETQMAVTDAASKTHSAVIHRMLANDQVDDAVAYYDRNKKGFGALEVTQVEKSLEEAQGIKRGMAAWDTVGDYKLHDGNPDLAKMQEQVMSDDSLGDKEKQKVWDFVKAKAGEDRRIKAEQDASKLSSFMDKAVTSRKQGVPLEEAMKLPSQMANSPYQQVQWEDAIQKIYAPAEVKTDQKVAVALWESIQNGTATQADIDRAQKFLAPKDWAEFSKDLYKVTAEGKSPEMVRANEGLKKLARDNFTDQEVRDAFMSEVHSAARGQTPDEMIKIANDKLKIDPATKSSLFGLFSWGGDKNYETDANVRNATSLAFGKAEQDLGPDTVRSIRQSALKGGAKSFTPADFDAFTVQMGGYDKIKPGTPANTAIQSLIRRGERVTPANINAVLSIHPDGNWK